MKKLTKSNDKVLTGVLGGFAEYFGADKALVRIIGAALMMVTGFFPGVFLYIIAAVIMPEKTDKDNDERFADKRTHPHSADAACQRVHPR